MLEHITLPESNDCQRIFHGRGHAFPGFEHVNIDWLPPVCLIIVYKEVDETWLNHTSQFLSKNITQCTSVQIQYRNLPKAPITTLIGENIEHTIVSENGIRFNIELGKNQNYGLFPDIVNGRKWVKDNCEKKNVLNLFAYTCAFSVAAIAGGASKVVNVDISKSSLTKGRENHRINEHDLKKVKFEGVNIFKSYSRLKKHGPYDLLICDPPSFQQGSVDIKRDYKKIIARIPQLMNENADVMLCLNSPDLDESFLLDLVSFECPECRYIRQIDAPDIYAEAHQGKGLKVLLFKYKPN